MNREAILWAKKRSFSLIVAFDCGTNAQQEVELAATLGIDIVIVDHHHIKHVRPGSFAFINPKRKDSSYPFSDLSAGALSFKLLQVLTGSDCYDVLDLVALSLVCDVVPLKGENRSLLKEGLKVIRRSSRACIKALCKVGRIEQGSIDTFHIGYILGPRINASGRVAHADESLKLFLAEDEKEAYDYALKLGKYNKQRRVIEAEILKQAEQKVQGNVKEDKVIVVSGDDWHQGVLGIVASRLANKYYRPSFVISFDQDKGKGSARSTVNVHLIEMLDKCSDMLLLYGGHSKAAGIQIDREKLSNFKERINSLVEKNLTLEDFIPAIDIDAVLSFKDIDMVLVEDLQKLAPYGEANAKPLFAAYNVSKKSSPNKINSYFSLWLSDGEKTFEGIIYDKDILEIISYADTFNIVFSLEKNHYHNIPKLIIRDCRLSDGDG